MGNQFKMVLFSGFFSIVSLNGFTQPVTVNSNGGADFTSISSALDAVASNADEPNILTITGGGPYNEIIIIGTPVTIRGESADNRPIILINQNNSVSGRESDGIVNSAAVDITFENLIFLLPSLEATPSDDGFDIRPFSDDDNFSVTVRNVLITANNGSNEPLSVDGKELQDFSGATTFGDDGFQILSTFAGIPSGTINALFENVIVTHNDGDGNPTEASIGGQDSFILGGERLTVTMRNVTASFGDRWGFQLLSNVTANLEGTPTEPIVCRHMGSAGILAFSGNHRWSYVDLIDSPLGVRFDADTLISFEGDHLLIANGTSLGMGFFFAPPNPLTVSISDSTFFNNAEHLAFRPLNETNALRKKNLTVNISDSIFAGFGIDSFIATEAVELVDDTPATVNLSHSAVVLEEPNDIFKDFGNETVNEVNIIEADPKFLSDDPARPDYLVVSADAYRNAASDGGFLSGAKPFAGETVSVLDWMMY